MKQIFLSLLLLVFVLPIAAQPLSGSSNYEQLMAAADSARVTQNWFVALENYEEAYDQYEEEELLPTIALMNLNLLVPAHGRLNVPQV